MKLLILAGGIGTRLWPLSRENSPKQFDRIFSGKSTLQLAVGRVAHVFGIENIFIQTSDRYKDAIREQIPELALENIIIEPGRRNLGPAVCLGVLELKKRGYSGPMAILWADHLMDNSDEFTKALQAGEELINQDPERFIFIGEHPRFANNNLARSNRRCQKLFHRPCFFFAGNGNRGQQRRDHHQDYSNQTGHKKVR